MLAIQHNASGAYVNKRECCYLLGSPQYGTRYLAVGCRILRFYRETAGFAMRAEGGGGEEEEG